MNLQLPDPPISLINLLVFKHYNVIVEKNIILSLPSNVNLTKI